MNPAGNFGSHLRGTSVVHRAPLGVKLVGVLAVGVTPWLARATWPLVAVLAVVLGVAGLARLPLSRLVRSLRAIAPVLALLFAFQWWATGATHAARAVLGIANAYLAAGVLTATTPVSDMLDGLVGAARPLRRVVPAEVVALTLGVVVRSVPWVAGSFSTVRRAARARGLERSPRAVVVPTVVHIVAYARTTGEALAARGLTDPDDAA